MTITAQSSGFIQTPGNGLATIFAAPFKCFTATDVVVGFIVNGAYLQQIGGYQVTNIDVNGGFKVVFSIAPPLATTVDIRTVTPLTQGSEFANLGQYLPENVTEAFDRVTREMQDIYRLTYTFGIHGPDTEQAPWPALPNAAGRKGNVLIFDAASGLPTVGTPTSQTITTGLLAPFLNLGLTAIEQAAGVTPSNFAYPPYTPPRYGADPTGILDSTAAINLCTSLGSAKVDFMGGTYLVSASTHAGLPGTFGTNSVCLQPRSNQVWDCTGATFNLATTYQGASGAIVGNWTGTQLNNFYIIQGTFQGNRTLLPTGAQCSAVQLVDTTNCHLEGCFSNFASYNAFGMRRYAGVPYGANYGSYMCSMRSCVAAYTQSICYQVNRPVGMLIANCHGYTSGDNGIDIEGNDTAGGSTNAGFSQTNLLIGNILQGNASGIFVESCGDVDIVSNNISQVNTAGNGIILNRINSGALGINILGNKLKQAVQSSSGVFVNGNTGKVFISGNHFDNWNSSIYLNATGSTNVAIGTNYHRSVARYCVEFPTTTNSVVYSWIGKQVLEDAALVSGGLPYLHPPYGCPSNLPNRALNMQSDGMVSLQDGKTYLGNYQKGWSQLTYNGTWSAYSLYNSGSDGKTRVVFAASTATISPGVLADTMTAGDFFTVGGIAYKVSTAPGDGSTYVQQWNGTAYVDGDFHGTLNAAFFLPHYYSQWNTN